MEFKLMVLYNFTCHQPYGGLERRRNINQQASMAVNAVHWSNVRPSVCPAALAPT